MALFSASITPFDHVLEVRLLGRRLQVRLLDREVVRARHDAVEPLDPLADPTGVAELSPTSSARLQLISCALTPSGLIEFAM